MWVSMWVPGVPGWVGSKNPLFLIGEEGTERQQPRVDDVMAAAAAEVVVGRSPIIRVEMGGRAGLSMA